MMTKDTMPIPDTGVYRRPTSTLWQWRIKTPVDLQARYTGSWAHRISLGTSDLREANEKACGLRSEWLARFAEQRRELNSQMVDKITPDLAHMLALRVSAAMLAADEKLRTDPEASRLLMLALREAVPSRLTIGKPR